MRTFSFALILLLALTSCVTPRKSFSRMSSAEIMAYNRTVDYLDQVYCEKRSGTVSHIPRRECRTYRDMAEGRPGNMNTPSSSTSIPQPQ